MIIERSGWKPMRHLHGAANDPVQWGRINAGYGVAIDFNLRLLLSICCAVLCSGQTPEMASHESQPTFTSRSNLVLVRVVVRDKKGQPHGTLQKEDFQLFDKGKPQVISKFSVEKSGEAKPTRPGL